MKAIAVTLLSLSIASAHASYMATHCSNAKGTVKWESGHNSNTINLKYSNFIEGTLTLDISQVKIDFQKEVTLSEKNLRTCGYASQERVYAGKVKIKASPEHPDVLRGQFPANKVETEVICTFQANSRASCPDNN